MNDTKIPAIIALIFVMAAFLLMSCSRKDEAIVPEWDYTGQQIQLTVHVFATIREKHRAIEARGYAVDPSLAGFAIMSPSDTVCEIFIVRPKNIDDENTLTLGHEVLHCLYGRYHKE